MRTIFVLVVLGSLTVTSIGSAEGSQPEVLIKNLAYSPSLLSVRAGTVMIFKNADTEAHSVVAANGTFNSQALEPGTSFAITFDKPGDVRYFCGVHPFMEGRVIVTR